MITCPVCSHVNADGTLICSNCNHLLVNVTDTRSTVTLNIPAGEFASMLPAKKVAVLTDDEIELYVEGSSIPIVMHVQQQVLFGRHTPNINAAQFVDLVPYGGFKKGISRAHAVIRHTQNSWTLTDMGSVNGTMINEIRLPPYTPRPLNSRDRIRLGQLEIEFYGGPSPKPTDPNSSSD